MGSCTGAKAALRTRVRALAAALDPERIVFYPEYLEVHFPAGTVAGQTQERILQWDYDQLGGLLQPWAVPEGTEAAE